MEKCAFWGKIEAEDRKTGGLISNFTSDNVLYMQESTRGIILHTLRYGEDSLIVDVFTLARGRVSFLVRSSGNRRRGMAAVMSQPLGMVDLVYDYRPKCDLQRVSSVHVSGVYASIPFDPVKGALVLFLSDFLYYALRYEAENEPLFRYVCAGMEWLDSTQGCVSNFHLVFLIRLTRFLGFWPSVGRETRDMVFDMRNAVLRPESFPNSDCLDAAESAALPLLLRITLDNMHLLRLNRHQRRRILELIEKYYRIHIPEFPELKSTGVMMELFS